MSSNEEDETRFVLLRQHGGILALAGGRRRQALFSFFIHSSAQRAYSVTYFSSILAT